MVQKISKLKISRTESQEDRLWASTLSHRNKLLSNSDWTQLLDSGLTESCVAQWKDWRRQLKSINRANYGSLESAETQINNLSRRRPFNVFSDTSGVDSIQYLELDEYRSMVLRYLDEKFNEKCNASFINNPLLVNEQYNEAIRYLASRKRRSESFPLIDLEVELSGKSHRTVALEFKELKDANVAKIATLKRKYHYFQSLVNSAVSDVQLSELQMEIKQWILTST